MRMSTCALLVLLVAGTASAQNLGTPAGGADMQSLAKQLNVDLGSGSEAGAGPPKISTTTTGAGTGRAYVPPEGHKASDLTMQQVENAARFLESMGNTQEAARVRALAADGKIRGMDGATASDMGETKGDYIYLNEGKIGKGQGSVVGLAQTLIHEMDHTGQSDMYQGAAELWGYVGGRPHEVDSYEKTIQTVQNWIQMKEKSLEHERDPARRAQTLKEIKGLIGDNQTYIQAVKDNGYEGIFNDLEIYTSGGTEHDSDTYAEYLEGKLKEYNETAHTVERGTVGAGGPGDGGSGGTLMGPNGPSGGGTTGSGGINCPMPGGMGP